MPGQAEAIFEALKHYTRGLAAKGIALNDALLMVNARVREVCPGDVASSILPSVHEFARGVFKRTETERTASAMYEAIAGYVDSKIAPLEGIAARVRALEAGPNVQIQIEEHPKWGDDGQHEDVRSVVFDVIDIYARHLPAQPFREVTLRFRDGNPTVLYRVNPDEPIVITLSAAAGFHAQIAYQMGSRWGSVVQSDGMARRHPEGEWFRAAISEALSICVQCEMAKRWRTHRHAPWASEAAFFVEHAIETVDGKAIKTKHLTADGSWADWFAAQEPALRKSSGITAASDYIACNLVHIFQSSPDWGAVCEMPDSAAEFRHLLQHWREACAPEHRGLVDEIRRSFAS